MIISPNVMCLFMYCCDLLLVFYVFKKILIMTFMVDWLLCQESVVVGYVSP